MRTIHKIFFDAYQPGLVYLVAAILNKIGREEISVFIPAIPSNINNEKSVQNIVYDLPMPGVMDSQNEEKIYILGIGPKNQDEEEFMLTFLERHQGSVVFCLDNHSWSKSGWEQARKYCLMKRYDLSAIGAMMALKNWYPIPISWQMVEKSLSSKKEATIFENPTAKRYFLSLEVSWTMDQHLDNNYYVQTFWNIVQEIADGKNNAEISCLADLGLLARQEAEEAINRLSDDSPHFAEAKLVKRPVGYLKLGEVGEYTDITGILEEGIKKFPWLVILDYSIKGKEYLSGRSKEIDIDDILNYYFQLNLSKDNVLKCINAEIIRSFVNA